MNDDDDVDVMKTKKKTTMNDWRERMSCFVLFYLVYDEMMVMMMTHPPSLPSLLLLYHHHHHPPLLPLFSSFSYFLLVVLNDLHVVEEDRDHGWRERLRRRRRWVSLVDDVTCSISNPINNTNNKMIMSKVRREDGWIDGEGR